MRASGVRQVLIFILVVGASHSHTRMLLCTAILHLGHSFGEGTHADNCAAEFRGPGTHHRFDDSPDDYDMDMDQRTRFIGGRAGRIILLGDGTEVLMGNANEDDGDVDMEDRGEAEEEEDDDLEEQVQKDDPKGPNGEVVDQDRSKREETPEPAAQGQDSQASGKTQEAAQQNDSQASNGQTAAESKTEATADSTDSKTSEESTEKK